MDGHVREVFKCRACGGVYSAFCRDGSMYHHVCAPLVDYKTQEFRLRDGHRDENLVTGRNQQLAGIRSEGAGVDPVPPCTLPEPTWLTKLRQAVQTDEEED